LRVDDIAAFVSIPVATCVLDDTPQSGLGDVRVSDRNRSIEETLHHFGPEKPGADIGVRSFFLIYLTPISASDTNIRF
jgi:hypothetical protein